MGTFALWYERICRVIMNVFVVHVAFIAHTLLGAVVVGLFPSVAAANTTFRTWILDVKDREWTAKRTWTVFHRAWKSELRSANLFGWPQALIGAALVWSYLMTNNNDFGGTVGYAVSGITLLLIALYGLFVFLSWVLRANFDEGPWWIVRESVLMVVARPGCSFILLFLSALTIWAYWKWPGLAVAFGVAVPAFFAVMTVYSFGRLPGMDVHVVEPVETMRRKKEKRQNRKGVVEEEKERKDRKNWIA